MKSMRHNILLNPAMQLWDYGTTAVLAALPSHGYLANRWKITRLGASEGTVSRTSTPNTVAVPKWMRNSAALTVAVGSTSSQGTVKIAQTIEDAVLWHRGLAVATIIASGPAGATFDVALGAEVIGTITTRGETEYVTATLPAMVGDTTTASGIAEFTVLTNPSTVGAYRIAFAQLRMGATNPHPGQLEVRSLAQERALCARYARPLGAGMSGPSTSSKISFPIAHPVEMRQGPTWLPAGGSVETVNVDTGARASMTDPSWTTGYNSTTGIRIVTTGWSGLSAGTLMVTTPVVGLLHADY